MSQLHMLGCVRTTLSPEVPTRLVRLKRQFGLSSWAWKALFPMKHLDTHRCPSYLCCVSAFILALFWTGSTLSADCLFGVSLIPSLHIHLGRQGCLFSSSWLQQKLVLTSPHVQIKPHHQALESVRPPALKLLWNLLQNYVKSVGKMGKICLAYG